MYQIAPGFIHRNVAGNDILISTNLAILNGYIALNETSSFLLSLMNEPKTAEQLAESIVEQYDVSYDQALADVTALLQTLVDRSLVQEVTK